MTGIGAKNPAVQQLRRLSRRRSARTDSGSFVIDGPVLVGEALDAGLRIDAVYVELGDDGRVPAEIHAVADRAERRGATRHDLFAGVLAGAADTVTPHGIAAVASFPRSRTDLGAVLGAEGGGGAGPVVVLAGVGDPGNAGTLLRSAEAAGARAVVATAGSVDLFAPKVVRASAGSVFRVPVVVDAGIDDLLLALAGAGVTTVGTAADAVVPYDRTDLTAPLALVLGNEAHGLDPALARQLDSTVSIPMAGEVESLNVAMAGTLLLFEAARQRRASGR
jgi:TrmH family RNA methyltransferase